MTKFDYYLMMIWVTGIWGSQVHWYGFVVSVVYGIFATIDFIDKYKNK